MDKGSVLSILAAMNRRMQEEKEFLTDLDNAIADGDHGINMARGFAAVEEKLPQLADRDLGTVFRTVGMTLLSVVAGSAGPLYGTAFIKAGAVMADRSEMTLPDLLTCLSEAIGGIMMRGRAVQGEKTMLDAMIPALDAMKQAHAAGDPAHDVLAAGVAAARDGVEYTKTIIATKGRASYIGERSLGHQDPGATSFTDLLEVVADAV